jgi:cyclase
LAANHGVVDNSGFIVGRRGVLVIDSHINGAMARQILDAVRRVTEKPILYLVNTNYHGDHTFGNYMFPASTTIIAHRKTAEHMRHFEHEKAFMLATVEGDQTVFGEARLRLPDIVFEDSLRIDLGGRVVELYHFGTGNTDGDVVVYEPEAKAVWTGNLVVGAGTIPPMFEHGAATYLQTLTKLQAALDIKTIVPGHGALSDGSLLARYVGYCSKLIETVRTAIGADMSLEQLLGEEPLEASYLSAVDSPMAAMAPLLQGLHLMNLVQPYQEEMVRGCGSGQ